jgi:hypothetical protein
VLWGYTLIDSHNLTLRADDVGDPTGTPKGLAVAGTVGLADLTGCVREKWEWEIMLVRKRRLRVDRVRADAQDLSVVLFELTGSITEPDALDRSARRISTGIEPQDYGPSSVIAKAHITAGMVLYQEIRRQVTPL